MTLLGTRSRVVGLGIVLQSAYLHLQVYQMKGDLTMEKQYETPEMEIILLNGEDVIVTSPGDTEGEELG